MPPSQRALDLPPPFRAVVLREVGDAFAHARSHAGSLGAGALVLVGRFDLIEFSVVLEPAEPLDTAQRAFYAGMLALVDTLAGLAPPETPITLVWPDRIYVGEGLVGGGRLAWPEQTDGQATPDWLVFGAMVRLAFKSRGDMFDRASTALEDEGFGVLDVEPVIAGFARHLMAAFNRWEEGDFASLALDYLARLPREPGLRHAIERNGDLRVERQGIGVSRRDLRAALAAPSWLDPATGEPR